MKYLLAGSVTLAMYVAVTFDLLFLVAFGIAALALATPLFERTL